VLHEEIEIPDKDYQIKANIKIPTNEKSKNGVILAHGSIINRQSLLRNKYSFGEYLCEQLDAYVIAPDFQGDTIHKKEIKFSNFSEIFNITTKYAVETYGLDKVMGFGHSMGSYVVADAIRNNKYLGSLITYGGPVKELQVKRASSFIDYLVKYLSTYNYSINIRRILKYVFDKETCRFLEDVMLKDESYCGDTYVFDFDSRIFMDIKNVVDNYVNYIKKWGKPALILYGTEDGTTFKTIKHFLDNSEDENITFKHIRGASHVTPCMDSLFQVSKLKPVIHFFEQTVEISKYEEKKRKKTIIQPIKTWI